MKQSISIYGKTKTKEESFMNIYAPMVKGIVNVELARIIEE
jgi:hypothetical protein